MIIHVVQPNETVYSISQKYKISQDRLELDNNLPPNNTLNVGQALMIAYPEQTYVVQEGDTLDSIAAIQKVTKLQLLRNNPQLSDSTEIKPGEDLVIRYHNGEKKIEVIGYTTPYINEQILRKTLPYLTYINIYNFKITPAGNFYDINDASIVHIAKQYGVQPIMFLSALTEQGKGSYGITHSVITNTKIQDVLIENVLIKLNAMGYYGLNLALHNILVEDMPNYIALVEKFTKRLNKEGFVVFVTLTPYTMKYQLGTEYKYTYFHDIGQVANYVILISYLWASAEIAQVAETTSNFLDKYLNYVVTQIPPQKIFVGLSRIAYDWELPYVPGDSIGSSLSNSGAINLANQLGATIQFNEETQTPYFFYNDAGIEHYVWFKDSRSINAILSLVTKYGLKGIAIWNIMYYHSPTWLSLNSQYEIATITDETLGI